MAGLSIPFFGFVILKFIIGQILNIFKKTYNGTLILQSEKVYISSPSVDFEDIDAIIDDFTYIQLNHPRLHLKVHGKALSIRLSGSNGFNNDMQWSTLIDINDYLEEHDIYSMYDY